MSDFDLEMSEHVADKAHEEQAGILITALEEIVGLSCTLGYHSGDFKIHGLAVEALAKYRKAAGND